MDGDRSLGTHSIDEDACSQVGTTHRRMGDSAEATPVGLDEARSLQKLCPLEQKIQRNW